MKPRPRSHTKVDRRRFLASAASAGILILTHEHLAIAAEAAFAGQLQNDCFAIQIVDEETERGVPLVELKLTNSIRYYTDSNGIVAFSELGLMDQKVWFSIHSPGYEFPEKPFGEPGKVVQTIRGGKVALKIRRLNVAERLYRLTGEGIYRDSVLVGAPVPIKHPMLDAEVMGQDTVETALYRGKIYWFFGDTSKASFHLGNFGTSGATSGWQGKGGLDPSVGVDLDYFADVSGFSKPMVPASAVPGPGPKWIDAVMVVEDDRGSECLVANFVRVKNLGEMYERGLIIFNDKTESFDRLAQFDLHMPVGPAGRPLRVRIAGELYYYFPSPYPAPLVRVKANLQSIRDPSAYEGFTCLTAGTQYQSSSPKLDRASDGRLIYGWKRGTPPLDYKQQRELVAAGQMKPEEGLSCLIDIDTGSEIEHTTGTVYRNDYRRCWIMITLRNLQEVYYAEGDTPLGPWGYARKVAIHDHYTFYWPAHFPFLDQEGGRVIYFAGTYTNSFSGNPDQTPRYEYNQVMYRLNLEDPRLFLPVPIYRIKSTNGESHYMTREGVEDAKAWDLIEDVPFFALPPQRASRGLVPIFSGVDGSLYSCQTPPASAAMLNHPLFCALPAGPPRSEQNLHENCKCEGKSPGGVDFAAQQDKSPAVVLLYEYQKGEQGARGYSTNADLKEPGLTRSANPVCRVWRTPKSLMILERHARPA